MSKKEEAFEVEGTVTQALANTRFRVTLETGDGETLVCDQDGMGDNPWADDVVRELSG